MATVKTSLTLDEQLLDAARSKVGRRGLSSYVNQALRRQLQRDRLQVLLNELENEHGPIDPGIMDEVRELWPDPADEVLRRSA